MSLKICLKKHSAGVLSQFNMERYSKQGGFIMSEIRDLDLKLIGVINDAFSLPQDIKRILREDRSIRVLKDKRNNEKWFAMVTFRKEEDNFFTSPTTALTEKNINYFLIQARNTDQKSTIVVKTGAKEKPGKVKADGEGNQRCNIRGAATIIRVSQNGNVGIYRVNSPTIDNKKQIKVSILFKGTLPFKNKRSFNAKIKKNKIPKEFVPDLKKAYASINGSRLENKDQKIKRVEAPAKKERLMTTKSFGNLGSFLALNNRRQQEKREA